MGGWLMLIGVLLLAGPSEAEGSGGAERYGAGACPAESDCRAPARPTAWDSVGYVVGQVRADGVPLPLARLQISARGGTRTIASDEQGRFLASVPTGAVVVEIAATGFAAERRRFVLAGGDTVSLLFELRQAVVTLDELQVTATPHARDPLAVPQSITTVSGRALERARSSSLGGTLAGQPGISVRFDGPGASAPVIRGLSGERIVILQDGHRTGDLAATAPDHAVTIDPSSASRIEIVRGPAALLYGNNAVGGVVNVISGDLSVDAPLTLTGTALLSAESGTRGGSAAVEAQAPLGERGLVRIRAGARDHGPVAAGRRGRGSQPDDDVAWADGRAFRLGNTNSSVRTGSVGTGWRFGGGSVAAAARFHDFEYGLPHAAGDDPVLLSGGRQELLFRIESSAGPLSGIRLDGGQQWYDHDEADGSGEVLTRLGVSSGHVQAVGRTPDLSILRDGAAGVSLSWRNNSVTGDASLTPPNSGGSVGAFIYQEVAPFGSDRVRFPVGLRLDRHRIRSRTTDLFGAGTAREFVAPSGSVGIMVRPGGITSVGASLSRAVRSPTAEELFSMAGHAGTGAFEIGDPRLAAEYATGGEVVGRVRGARVRAEVAAYVNDIRGWIGLFPTGRDTLVSDGAGGTRAYPLHVVSQRDARLTGVEGAIDWSFESGIRLGVMGDAVRARDAEDGALPFIPSGRLGASVRYEVRGLDGGIRGRRVFRQGPVPPGELRASAHLLVDADVSYAFMLAGRRQLVTVRAENVLDEAYRDAASRIKSFAPNPGRSIIASYAITF
jgi:iron complex outermembrane recepter protein